jgi:hypothetical protein
MGNMWTTFWIELPSILHRQWLQVALHASAIGPQLCVSLDILLDIGGEILQINANHTEIIPQIRVFIGIRTGSFSLACITYHTYLDWASIYIYIYCIKLSHFLIDQDCPQDMSAFKITGKGVLSNNYII